MTRSYINVTGNLSHVLAFRITPDIARETNPASSLAGSLEFRVKYAFLQTNLDDWMTPGSWARFGIQQTPYVDFAEGIYRYRFQGTMFVERAGFMSSSDAGVSFHYNLRQQLRRRPRRVLQRRELQPRRGQRSEGLHDAGHRPPVRAQQARASWPARQHLLCRRQLREDGERKRTVGAITYEHPWVVAGFEYLDARDQRSALPGNPLVKGDGYTIWVTPRTSKGWEGLLRYDHLTPNTSTALAPFATSGNLTTTLDSQQQNRVIAGVAYWFKLQGSVTASLLVDYDAQLFENLTAAPTKTVAVHALVNF